MILQYNTRVKKPTQRQMLSRLATTDYTNQLTNPTHLLTQPTNPTSTPQNQTKSTTIQLQTVSMMQAQ